MRYYHVLHVRIGQNINTVANVEVSRPKILEPGLKSIISST